MNVAKNYQTFETSTFLPLILAFKNVIFMIFLVLKIERKRNESFTIILLLILFFKRDLSLNTLRQEIYPSILIRFD